MKKILVPLLSLTMLSTLLTPNLGVGKENTFEETTLLEDSKGYSLNYVRRNATVGSEFHNYMFTQNASKLDEGKTYHYMRFATPVKGDISSLSYTRHVDGLEDKTIEVTTIYKSLQASGELYYFDGSGITTINPNNDFYWACYTVRFAEDSKYVTSDIQVTLDIDGKTLTKTTSLQKELRGDVINIAYDGDSINVSGTGEINQKVKVTYENGDVVECGTESEDIRFIKSTSTNVLGMKSIVRVESSKDSSIYIEIPAIMERVLQGEDATIVGGSAKTEAEYVIENGVYVNKGNTSFAGNFSKNAIAGKDAYIKFDSNVEEDTLIDLTLRCANSNLRKDDAGYYMAPLQINTIADLYVNDNPVTISDDVILQGLDTRNADYGPCYNVYSNFTFKNIPVKSGNNTIKLQFKASTIGEVNHWSESPSTMNIDYISIVEGKTLITEQLIQGEDATIIGGKAKTEVEYSISEGKFVEKENTTFAGDFSRSAIAGSDAYVEFDTVAYMDGQIDLTLRCANSNLRKDDAGYYMAPLQINTIADLYVNDNPVTISNDVILQGLDTRNADYGPCYNVYSNFTFKNLSLKAGHNTIKLQFKASTIGEVNHWNESPSTMNIDYISIAYNGPTEVEEKISAIEIQHADSFKNELVVVGTYGSQKAVVDSSKYEYTRTYDEINKSFKYIVVLKENPSINCEYYEINLRRLESEEGTTFGKSANNKVPNIQDKTTYELQEDGTIIESGKSLFNGGFDATTSAKNSNDKETGVEAGVIVKSPYAGNFNLSIRMTNALIKNGKALEVNLDELLKIEIDGKAMDLTGKKLRGVDTAVCGLTENDLFMVFQTISLGEIELNKNSEIKLTYFGGGTLETNKWDENPAGNIDYLNLSCVI